MPVPVSPWMSTVASDAANRSTSWNRWRIAALPPTMPSSRLSDHNGSATASASGVNVTALLPSWMVAPGAT